MKICRVLFLAVLCLVLRVTGAHASDGATVAPGATTNITGPDGVCRKVTNTNGSYSLYVSTASTNEWQNFLSNPGVASLAACCVRNGGEGWSYVPNGCCTDIYDNCGAFVDSDCSGCGGGNLS